MKRTTTIKRWLSLLSVAVSLGCVVICVCASVRHFHEGVWWKGVGAGFTALVWLWLAARDWDRFVDS